MDNIKFTDLDSIMKAATAESESIREKPVEAPENKVPESNNLPSIKEAINSANLGSIVSKLTSDPNNIANIMEQSLSKLTPEMIEEAKKLSSGGYGQNVIKEMQRRGMDVNAVRNTMNKNKRAMKKSNPKPKNLEGCKSVVMVTQTRRLKPRTIENAESYTIAGVLHVENPIAMPCSRLAVGPLKDKTVTVWCDPSRTDKNRRLSKILGLVVGGDGLVVVNDENLTLKDFEAAEKLLA